MFSIAIKMLLGDKTKYMGLIFGIAFATLLIVQQSSIFCGLMIRTASVIVDVREADIWVMHPRVQYIEEVEPLADTALTRVRGVPGVRWAVPLHKSLVVARSSDALLEQVVLIGVDDASLTGAPGTMLLGKREDLRLPDAVIIDRAGFESIWPGQPVQTGKILEFNDKRAVLVGVCEASPPFVTFPIVYTRYTNAMRILPPQRRQLSFVIAKAEPGLNPAVVAAEIEARTALQAKTWEAFSWSAVDHYLRRTGIPINFGITVALGFFVGAAIAGQTFYLFTIENLKQFAALKALGVENRTILGMILLQALVVGLVGYGIGMGLAGIFFESTATITALRGFFMPWQIVAGTCVLVLMIVALAGIVSARKVLMLDPAVVFRG